MKNHLTQNFSFEPSFLRQLTQRVDAVEGINLGQGVCQLPVPDLVLQSSVDSINKGANRYAPARGIPLLREVLAERLKTANGIPCQTEDIIITHGSTGAYEILCECFLNPGDEIILFAPIYPYHNNAAERRGAVVNILPLTPDDVQIDFDRLEQLFTDKTKYILVCTPNNPTGKVFSMGELERIQELCHRHGAFLITDEVYEYMTYDGHKHVSPASLPGQYENTITMGSYSKTFSITGWRVGYLCVPPSVTRQLGVIADQMYVCSPTPFQHAVAEGVSKFPDSFYTDLNEEYRHKRELMAGALVKGGFDPILPQGAYYMLADCSQNFPGKTGDEVLDVMIDKAGVAAIPSYEFYPGELTEPGAPFLRFCFSVPDEILIEAGERLGQIGHS